MYLEKAMQNRRLYKGICTALLAVIFYLLCMIFCVPSTTLHTRIIQYLEVAALLIAGVFFCGELFLKQPLYLRLKRKMQMGVILVIAILLSLSLFLEILILSGAKSSVDKSKAEAILVLGTGLMPDGSPTATLRCRLKKAAEVAIQYPELPLILTGGMGGDEPVPEAETMADFLAGCGIDRARMHLESKSSTTKENFRFSHGLVQWKDVKHPCVFVVTTDFHMFRSCWIGRDQGYVCIPCPAEAYHDMWIINHPREQLGIIKHFILRLF